MADVHHHHQPAQLLALREPGLDEGLPVRLQFLRHLGVAVAGQVDEVALLELRQLEVHQLLGAPRRLRHTGERALPAQRVERAGLAGVGTPGEGDLEAAIGRQLPRLVGGEQVARAIERRGWSRAAAAAGIWVGSCGKDGMAV